MRSLNRQIDQRQRDMARQRRCALQLLQKQRETFDQQARHIPLPVVLGLAVAGGFAAERFFHTRAPSNLWRLYLAWRTF
ncbi:hypothetical protein [Microbulbifer litoralis]|uniref:hypothetical protein n=1 Tax=Microbulbifer litoralis TaxID=2933965 RepID=UPI002027AE07|nr:hypothetical protein [Microbulbifer sp. GX H0434]